MDTIKVEILEDGTVSFETDAISGVNHASADALLDALEEELGGNRSTHQKDKQQHAHHHAHKHVKAR